VSASTWQTSGVTRLDALNGEDARQRFAACCASRRWITAMLAARPYGTTEALHAQSDAALGELTWEDVLEALAAHPRIGQRADGGDREAAWSRHEQSGAATADQTTAAALRDGNFAYEQRFGFVFLICATGLSAEQMLVRLHERLTHDESTERGVVREELRRIVRLRLDKALDVGGAA
jgi:2-oxo-4-hydroxy-4-carboxy-5-ureidoimidazoline decarboxylase